MDLNDDDLQTLRWLRDRAEIGDLMRRYSYGTDTRDVAMMRSIFADEFECDFGPLGTFSSWDVFVAFAQATVFQMVLTQHVITTDLIEVQGDRATATYYGRNALQVPGPDGVRLVRTGARYDQELARTPDGWRITKHVCTPLWNDDTGGVDRGEMMSSMAERVEGGRD